jgi:hypothetical protein
MSVPKMQPPAPAIHIDDTGLWQVKLTIEEVERLALQLTTAAKEAATKKGLCVQVLFRDNGTGGVDLDVSTIRKTPLFMSVPGTASVEKFDLGLDQVRSALEELKHCEGFDRAECLGRLQELMKSQSTWRKP